MEHPRVAAWAIAVAIVGVSSVRADETPNTRPDVLAAEVARWSAFLRDHQGTDELWIQIKQGAAPAMARAEQALQRNRRLLALARLAAVRADLSAAAYVASRPAGERKDVSAFEAEWKRVGGQLGSGPPGAASLQGVATPLARALAEAAAAQVGTYYDASLEYGRNTTAESGLFYLGMAQAQRDFAELARGLSGPPRGRAPAARSLAGELDALESELLAAYRPPASIDRHREFIAASSALKEARELDAAGLRYGALLRYLQAVQRSFPFRARSLDPAAVPGRLMELEAQLAAGSLDHGIGRFFFEAAQSDLESPDPATGPVIAAAVAEVVLPRYLAALEPARPIPPPRAARATVTLVRWPYT